MSQEIFCNLIVKLSSGPVLELNSRDSDALATAYSFVRRALLEGKIAAVVTTDMAVIEVFMTAWYSVWHKKLATCYTRDSRMDSPYRGGAEWFDVTFYHSAEDTEAANDFLERAYYWALCA